MGRPMLPLPVRGGLPKLSRAAAGSVAESELVRSTNCLNPSRDGHVTPRCSASADLLELIGAQFQPFFPFNVKCLGCHELLSYDG